MRLRQRAHWGSGYRCLEPRGLENLDPGHELNLRVCGLKSWGRWAIKQATEVCCVGVSMCPLLGHFYRQSSAVRPAEVQATLRDAAPHGEAERCRHRGNRSPPPLAAHVLQHRPPSFFMLSFVSFGRSEQRNTEALSKRAACLQAWLCWITHELPRQQEQQRQQPLLHACKPRMHGSCGPE
jgi:hypothetical protein